MKTITIEIPEEGDDAKYFDVVDQDGRRCNGLTFDEMVGQVICLTYQHSARKNGYPMKTRREWIAERFARNARKQVA